MAKSKKTLLILSIIFNFVSVAWSIWNIISWFLTEPQYRSAVFYLIYSFIDIVALVAVAVLLILCLQKDGSLFRARQGLYMSAIIISIIMNLFSLETLFLILSIFTSDWQWVKEKDDVVPLNNNVEVITKTREQKIAELRSKKEKGEISEEQFQEELMKLL